MPACRSLFGRLFHRFGSATCLSVRPSGDSDLVTMEHL